jgi:branched-chain amino acid transport system substrate-binding protein
MTRPIVRIGFAAPFTGDQSIVGVPMRQCAELAAALANERGDLPFDVEVRGEDDFATPDGARAAAARFIADASVLAVVGHKNSGPSAAAAPLYAAARMTQITPSSTNSALSARGHATFFRMCAHDAIQGRTAARYAVRVRGAHRIAVLHDRTDYGRPLAEAVAAALGEEGAEVALFEGVAEGAGTFPETVARIRALAPDLVYFGLTEIEASIFARELRDAGVTALLFGTDGSPESKFLPLAGPAAEGSLHTYAGAPPSRAPAMRAFIEAFESRYEAVPVYGPEVFDAANQIIAAAAAAPARTRAAVLAGVATMAEFSGASGRVRFDENGDRVDPPISIWTVEHNAMKLLGRADDLIPG